VLLVACCVAYTVLECAASCNLHFLCLWRLCWRVLMYYEVEHVTLVIAFFYVFLFFYQFIVFIKVIYIWKSSFMFMMFPFLAFSIISMKLWSDKVIDGHIGRNCLIFVIDSVTDQNETNLILSLLRSESESESELHYNRRFTANQFILAPNPLRTTTRDIFQMSSCGNSQYVISSLMRRWICLLWICLGFRQVYISHT
jgi:hypothetical protein